MTLVTIAFTGPSYTGRSSNINSQECINLRFEVDKSGGKSVLSLLNRHCLEAFATIGSSPIRGMVEEDGFGYVVSGDKFYKVANDGTVSGGAEKGTLLTNSGTVGIASNGFDVFVTDGTYGYNYDIAADTFTQDVKNTVAGAGLLGGDCVTFIDQYFVTNKINSGVAQSSALADGTTWSALDIATAEGDPDNLVRSIAVHGDLWLMGSRTSEPYYNAAFPSGFPFARRQGFVDMGLAARWSAAIMDNTLYWLAQNREGVYGIVRAVGFTPQKVSTPAIDYQINKMALISDAIAWTFTDDGHSYYVITFPTGNKTWVYDAATNLWSEWRSYNLGRFKCTHHILLNNQHIVGDSTTGKLYKLKQGIYTDSGDLVERIRTTQPLHKSGRDITINKIWIDQESGVGISTGQGEDPMVMLQWSKDGGHTWSNEYWQPLGKMGEYGRRATWNRLGVAPSWVFRCKMTDPVKDVLISCYADIEIAED